jgi:hypothetical protein
MMVGTWAVADMAKLTLNAMHARRILDMDGF